MFKRYRGNTSWGKKEKGEFPPWQAWLRWCGLPRSTQLQRETVERRPKRVCLQCRTGSLCTGRLLLSPPWGSRTSGTEGLAVWCRMGWRPRCWATVSSLDIGGCTLKTFYIWGHKSTCPNLPRTKIENTLDFWKPGRGKALIKSVDQSPCIIETAYQAVLIERVLQFLALNLFIHFLFVILTINVIILSLDQGRTERI